MVTKKKTRLSRKKQSSKTSEVVTHGNLPVDVESISNDTKTTQPVDSKMLDVVETFVNGLIKDTGFSKEEVIEALLYDHLIKSLGMPNHSMSYKVKHNADQVEMRR